MTWLGKILTFLVMVMALVWMFLNAQSFATRTNWKKEADTFAAGYKSANDAREKEYRAFATDKDALTLQLASASKKIDDLTALNKRMDEEHKSQEERYAKLDEANKKLQENYVTQAANLEGALEQVKQLRESNNSLQDTRIQLAREKEQALIDRQQAINERNSAQIRVNQLSQEREELIGQVNVLKLMGGKSPGAVAEAVNAKTAPLAENVRATVTGVDGSYVVLSIGLDAGLTPGAVLDVSRLTPSPKYLGTVKIMAWRLGPKEAVATFTSASGRDVALLRPEERPRIGDVSNKVPR